MKRITLLCALLIACCWQGQAQVLSESFNGATLPTGWTQEHVSGTEDWAAVTTNGNDAISPRTGSHMAEFRTTTSGDATKLVTPSMDITTLTSPQLTFYFANVNWVGDIDELRVYYKTSATGAWTQIGLDYTTEHTSWEKVSLPLPSPSADYYIAFEATSNWARGLDLDDVTVGEVPACLAPSTLIASNILATSADLGWTESGTATTWDLEVVTAGTTPTGTPTDAGVTANPYNKTGLTAQTDYEFYVRADCGASGTSTWVGPFAFTTLCAASSAPLTENFSGTSTPSCWIESGDAAWEYSTGASYAAAAAGDHTYGGGTNYAWMDGSDNGDGEVSTLTSPLVDISSLTNPALQFNIFSFNDVDAAANMTKVEFYDGANWIMVLDVGWLGPQWQYFLYDLSTFSITGPVQVRITVTGTANGGDTFNHDVLLDDVAFMEYPSCQKPSNLQVNNITATSADLSWTDNNNPTATLWDIELLTAGTAPTGTPTATGASNPYNVTGLSAQTDYEFYVRADCGGGDQSAWEGPLSFSTPCAVVVTPWLDDVEGHADETTFTESNCWTASATTSYDWNVEANGSGNSTSTGPDAPNSGAAYFYVEASSGSQGDVAELYTPMIDLTGLTTPSLQFYYHMYGQTMGDLYVDVFDGTTWVNDVYSLIGEQQTADTDPWLQAVVDLTAYTGTIQVRFRAIRSTDYYGDISLDDIEVKNGPTCFAPVSLNATNITATSADLAWSSSATTWDLEVVTAGTTPTGTPTNAGVTTNPYNLTSLTANTAYEFYVRADCGTTDGLSAWAGPYAFTTPCVAATLPYTESFTSGAFPSCWSRTHATDVSIEATCDTRSNVLNISDANDVITVPIDGTTSTTGLKVSYFIGDELCGGATEDPFTVSYWDGTQWVLAKTYLGDGSQPYENAYFHDSFIVPMSAVTAGFKLRFSSVETLNSDNWYIDELVVENAPTCLTPSALTATNIITTSADLGWTDANATPASLWDIEVVTAGTAPTGTPTDTGVTNPYTKTGLTDNTAYEFYVRADCGGGDLSIWAGPFAFTTLCVPATIPYSESFASGTFPSCWSRSTTADVTIEASCGSRSNVLRIDQAEQAVTATIDASTVTNGLMVSYDIADSVCGDGAESGEIFNVDYWDGTQWVNAKSYDAARPDAYTSEFFYVPQSDVSNSFKVRFDQIDGTTDSWLIDNVMVDITPTCLQPTALTVTNIMNSTADLGWTDNASTWDVHIVTAGTPAPGATTTPTDAGVTTNPYTKTGLGQCVTYEFYVRADCGGGDTSKWSGPYAFSPTGTGPATAPWTETFENNGSIPSCWTQDSANPKDWEFANSAGSNHIGDYGTIIGNTQSDGYFAWVDDSGSGDMGITLLSPYIDVSGLTVPTLNFYRLSNNEGYSNVDFSVDVWDGTAWNNDMYFSNTNSAGGGWEKVIVDLSSLTITGDIQVRFVIDENNGTDFYDDVAIDDVSVVEAPSCSQPTALTATNVLATSADLGWTESGTATTWDIELVTAGTTPTGTPTDVGVTSNPYNVTGLTVNTNYEFYVRADCGGTNGLSLWSGPFAFYTGYCPSVPTSNDGNGISNIQIGSNNYTGSDVTYLDFTATPADLYQSVMMNAKITFETGWTYDTNIWIDFNDDLVFDSTELVFTGASTNANPTTLDASFVVPASATLGTHGMRIGTADSGQSTPDPCYNGSYGVTADFTVNVIAAPSCLPPHTLTATNIMATSVDLGWTENNSPAATIWDLEVVTAGTTPTGTPTDIGVTTNPYNITGLTPNTGYDFYVRTDCGGGDTSPWSGPYSFFTACTPATLPYLESFSSGSFPNCWDRTSTSDVTVEASCGSRSNVLNISDVNDVTSAAIDVSMASNGVIVSYYIGDELCGGATEDPLNVSYWDGAQWVNAKTYLRDGSQPYENAYFHDNFIVPASAVSTNFQVRFSAVETLNSDNWYIDEFAVEMPPCYEPSNIMFDNITQTQADVSWMENGVATEWEVEYGATGFTPGSGTILTDNDGTLGETITGLTAATIYDVYVRSLCTSGASGNTSGWVGPVSFTTACDAIITFPYVESFEASSGYRPCWTMEYVAGSEDWEFVAANQNGTMTPKTGSSMAQFMTTNPGGVDVTKFVSPALDLSNVPSPQLKFYYANVSWMGDIDELRVYYKTSATGTWTQIGTDYTAEQTAWTEVVLNLPNPSADYYVAFEGTSYYGRGLNVDDVSIEAASCPDPSDIAVSNILTTAADISWTENGSATEWEIEYGTNGFTPGDGTGTIVADNDGTLGETLTGLTPETSYDVYVTAICAPGDESNQVGPETFTTEPLGVNDQVFEGFTYYPNPVNSQLSLKATSEIQEVVVYDLLGQEVLKSKPNSLAPILEFHNLQAGTYLMKVTIEGSVGVYRIIKE